MEFQKSRLSSAFGRLGGLGYPKEAEAHASGMRLSVGSKSRYPAYRFWFCDGWCLAGMYWSETGGLFLAS